MKKIYILFASLLVIAPFYLQAQPVLQYDNMAPIGFNAEMLVGAPVAPGSAGANQIWDYSGVQLTAYGTFEIVDPATTPYAGLLLYPSNYCYKMSLTSGESAYDYYDLNVSSMDKLGQNMSTNGGEIYTDTKIDLKFPFNYGESYFDTFAKTNGGTGTVTKKYDAYGTLITPGHTYQNVVRIYTVWDDMEWLYQWWSAENGHILLMVNSEISLEMSSGTTGIGQSQSDFATLSLSPNPARNYCAINGLNEVIMKIQLIDLTGKVVKTLEGKQYGFNVAGLVKGVYIVRITLESGKTIMRKLCVE